MPSIEPILEVDITKTIVGMAKVDARDDTWNYADGASFGNTSGSAAISFNGKRNQVIEGAKRAALLDACEKGNTDFIVDPRYNFTVSDSTWGFFPFSFGNVKAECTVRGFPAKIIGYKDVRQELWDIVSDDAVHEEVRVQALKALSGGSRLSGGEGNVSGAGGLLGWLGEIFGT